MHEFQVGDRVAEYDTGYPNRARLTTVERLTATQVVTASGGRFRRDTGYLVGDKRAYTGTRLLLPDDSQVLRAIATATLSGLRYSIDRALKDAKPGEALSTIDKIEALVRTARAQITDAHEGA